jgi:hypothetical protein
MKKVIRLKYILLIVFPVLLLSCSKDEPQPPEPGVPVISFVSGNDERKLKIGESVTLTAIVENVNRPVFSWKIDGKIVSTETSFTFAAGKLGEYFVNFRVDAANGSAEGQIKISVLEKVPPKIKLNATAIAYAGIPKEFVAEVDDADDAAYVWRLDGEVVSSSSSYTFNRTVLGNYLLSLKVTTAEGQDLKATAITVLPEPISELFFDDGRYRTTTNASVLRKMTVPEGKSLVLAPVICNVSDTVGFEWEVDGTVKQTGESLYYTFTPTSQGEYLISVTETGSGASATVEVSCTPPEGTYRRTGGEKAVAIKAFDFIPAPGQFINYQSGTVASALETMQKSVDGGGVPYIGAYGGYWILGYDHSISNEQDRADLKISGNAFAGWCEPGIVWVMQDNNGNGQPDDTWYELKGSETGKPSTRQRLAMTYYKPKAANSNVLWTDNIGRSGSVDWLGAHPQAYYYPMFIAEDYYTLTGTCLSSTFYTSGLEYSACYEWGYVDNISSSASRESDMFWIEDAIQADGSPANLKYIDFVKVHTGTTGKGAAVGEISTEAGMPTDVNFKP